MISHGKETMIISRHQLKYYGEKMMRTRYIRVLKRMITGKRFLGGIGNTRIKKAMMQSRLISIHSRVHQILALSAWKTGNVSEKSIL